MTKKRAKRVEAEVVHPIKLIKARTEPETVSAQEWEMSRKETKFLVEFFRGTPMSECVVKAGYTENLESAAVIGCKLLKKPRIAKIIRENMEAQLVCANLTGIRILKEIYLLATADVSQAFDAEGNLLEIRKMPEALRKSISGFEVEKCITGKPGTTVTKVKFWSKNHALELLGKHLKLLVDRIEIDAKGFESLQAPVVNETFVESKEDLTSSPGMEQTQDAPAAEHTVPGEVLSPQG